LAKALASFVRTILSGDSPVDHYLKGETAAISLTVRRGFDIFRGKGNCSTCHLGPNFSDEQFHNTGVGFQDGKLLDAGRFLITRKDADRGAFKTPILRGVARTGPYMHDGSFTTLAQVIDFYDGGGNSNPNLDPGMHPLRLTPAEKQALLAFLNALTGTVHFGFPKQNHSSRR
jgi:cytochrome c peroxidase